MTTKLVLFRFSDTLELALKLMNKAATTGCPGAWLWLAEAYYEGKVVERNLVESCAWYEINFRYGYGVLITSVKNDYKNCMAKMSGQQLIDVKGIVTIIELQLQYEMSR